MQPASTPFGPASVLSPKSSWQVTEIEAFLAEARLPLRVSTLSADGFPHITSLWFHYRGGRFYCCTQRNAQISLHLGQNPRAGFEVAVNDPPYRGISGVGMARVLDADAREVMETVVDRYLGTRDRKLKDWLMSRLATEVIIEITPHRLTSWDFSHRMTAPRPAPAEPGGVPR